MAVPWGVTTRVGSGGDGAGGYGILVRSKGAGSASDGGIVGPVGLVSALDGDVFDEGGLMGERSLIVVPRTELLLLDRLLKSR